MEGCCQYWDERAERQKCDVGGATERCVDPLRVPAPKEVVTQPFFSPFEACVHSTWHPRLAPWAAFFRRFAAPSVNRVLLFSRRPSCDTVYGGDLFLTVRGIAKAIP